MIKNITIFLLIVFILDLTTANAWIYPEHRDIALLAVHRLSPQYRQILDRLWAEARKGYENRLSENVINVQHSRNPKYLDFAAWPAIAGDHSCSAEEMLNTILDSDWMRRLLNVTYEQYDTGIIFGTDIDLNTGQIDIFVAFFLNR